MGGIERDGSLQSNLYANDLSRQSSFSSRMTVLESFIRNRKTNPDEGKSASRKSVEKESSRESRFDIVIQEVKDLPNNIDFRRSRSFDISSKNSKRAMITPEFKKMEKCLTSASGFLRSQDQELLNSAAKSIKPLANSRLLNSSGVHKKITHKELEALSTLAQSRVATVRKNAASVLSDLASKNMLPRGRDPLNHSLDECTKIMLENVHSSRFEVLAFALRVALTLSNKGNVWRERLIKRNWIGFIIEIILKIVSNHTVQPSLDNLSVASRSPRKLEMYEKEEFYNEKDELLLDDNIDYTTMEASVASGFNSNSNIHIYGQARLVLRLALKLMALLENTNDDNITTQLLNLLTFVLDELSAKSSSDISLLILVCNAFGTLTSNINCNRRIENIVVESSLSRFLSKAKTVALQISSYNTEMKTTIPVDNYYEFDRDSDEPALNVALFPRYFERDEKLTQNYIRNINLTKLGCEILCVLTNCCDNIPVASAIVEMFESHCVMRIVSSLYRSQVSGSRVIVARFLYALCKTVNEAQKLVLCDSGIIMKLLRLASPSTTDNPVDTVFIPAINALSELGKSKVIAARIILAGGLGPLYSHANSSRGTRLAARNALEILNIEDINDLIDWYVSKSKRNTKAESQAPVSTLKTVEYNSLRSFENGASIFHRRFKIGSGSFSTVYKGFLLRSESVILVALKKMTPTASKSSVFQREYKVLSSLPRHENIASFYGKCETPLGEVVLVFEYAGEHTLAWHLKNKLLSWPTRIRILIQVSQAIKWLHSQRPAILHLDIKASNIALHTKSNGHVAKVCDFGMAVASDLTRGLEFLNPQNCGTLQWMAPEVMREEDYEFSRGFDTKAEVFSFAILMWEVAHPSRIPWDELRSDGELELQSKIRRLVCSGRRLQCSNTKAWPLSFENLMRKCWRKTPNDRPSFTKSYLPGSENSLTISDELKLMIAVDLGPNEGQRRRSQFEEKVMERVRSSSS